MNDSFYSKLRLAGNQITMIRSKQKIRYLFGQGLKIFQVVDVIELLICLETIYRHLS